jgi:CDP-6-deoxy-D-xylo-4-hexulose-3-dehydrase
VSVSDPSHLKKEILRLSREYARQVHAAQRPGADPARPAFVSGQTTVPYAGRVFTEDEVEAAVSSTLDFWLTLGPEGEAFERDLAGFLGVKHALLVNSGSSANLLALTTLTSPKIPEKKRLRAGDEVITCAAGFPTTVAPILQNRLVPVFIDNDPQTGNARVDQLEQAFSPGRTKAVMMAHTLGNPFDLSSVLSFCRKHNLWLVEDNCDALGSTYSLPVDMAKDLGLDHLLKLAGENASTATPTQTPFIRDGILTAYTGSFGDLSTQSFYPPHHLTMGEGGAVSIISHPPLKKIVESFRDWGRDCWCPSGKDNTCGKRFGWQLGELPAGYDHKYIYSHLGYNLKPLDPQAAIGRVQLRRLDAFIGARRHHWEALRQGLGRLDKYFDFMLPTHAAGWLKGGSGEGLKRVSSTSQPIPSSTFSWDSSGCSTHPSWFGFMLRVRPSAPFTVRDLAAHLDEKRIGNRMLFGGNLVRQPVFVQLAKDQPDAFRVVGDLAGADTLMRQALFLGTYPGLTPAMLDYEISVIRDFCSRA